MRRHLILLALIPLIGRTQQDNATFYHLTTGNGLSCNHVSSVIQDREGFYWIATTDGLNRFDGSTCTIYRNQKNDRHSLSHNNCIFLLEDDLGQIWIATQCGISRFDKKTNQFEQFYLTHPSLSFERANWIRGLTKDNKGNIFISSGGLWQFNIHTRQWRIYLHSDKDLTSPPNGILSSLQYDSIHHGIWMNSETGCVFFDESNQQFYHNNYNPKRLAIISSAYTSDDIALDATGKLWFKEAKNNQLCYYDTHLDTIVPAPYKFKNGLYRLSIDANQSVWMHHWAARTVIYDPSTKSSTSSFLIYHHARSALDSVSKDLYIDKEKNYWISSSNGISIYSPQRQAIHYFILNDNEEQNFRINCVAEQNTDCIWIGTSKGMYQFNPGERSFKKMPSLSSAIHSIAFTNEKMIWLGEREEILLFDAVQKKIITRIPISGYVQFVKADNENTVWVGTWEDGLYQFSKEGKLVKHITEGNDSRHLFSNNLIGMSSILNNHFWIGYNGGYGFARFNTSEDSWQHFKVAANTSSQSTYNSITCITEKDQQSVWMGTSGGGIVCYHPQQKNFDLFTQSDGLKGGYINSILQDDSSKLWISTNNGLSVIDTRNNQVINPDIDLILPDDNFVSNGIKLKNHHLLFFAGNSLTEIEPDLFFEHSADAKIVLSSFKVFNKELALNESHDHPIYLKYNQNFFSVEYSLLKAFPSLAVDYAYLLEGFDKNWNYVKERRVAYYTNVPAGHYTFRIKATDASGKWTYFSEPVSIVVVPPFWQQAWFMVTSILLLALALFALYRYRINQLKKVYQLRSSISKDLHDEVASTLSGIRLYSELAKKQLQLQNAEQAYHSLEIISDNSAEMVRGMSDIVWTINPTYDSFSKLLQKLRTYASQTAQARKINFIMQVDESIPEEKLNMQQRRNIYLICKEAINNSVKHSHASDIQLSVQRNDSAIEILIKDNGIGFIEESGTGNGLMNMQLRAKEIGGRLTVHSKPDEGTEIVVMLKL